MIKMEWISVNDRLPEFKDKTDVGVYITCDKDGFVYGSSQFFDKENGIEKGFFTMVNGRWKRFENITHWMPLPDPPK